MGWIVSFLLGLFITDGAIPAFNLLAYALLHHYLPFMAIITVLFTVGGGIHISMKGKASPLMNAGLLGVGALLANIIGTMGASMLLIRPVIALNRYRKSISHIVIFFIFH
jgi:Na+/H+ antiporter NhaD/arsenite permease-like protein